VNAGLTPVGESLAARLRHIAAAMYRHDGFVGGSTDSVVGSPPPKPEPVTLELAREFVLRMLGVAASPRCADLLRELSGRELSTAQLAVLLDRPRLIVWEQVNDLVQVGLVGRDTLDDRVGLTAAGSSMTELIDDLVQRVAGVQV
jgi:hypothetical protein